MTSWDSTENGWRREVIMECPRDLSLSFYLSASLEMLNQKKSANEPLAPGGQGSPAMDYRPNPAHRASQAQAASPANKVLLAFSHAHWFVFCLRLLEPQRRDWACGTGPQGPQSWRYPLFGPFRESLPSPALGPSAIPPLQDKNMWH